MNIIEIKFERKSFFVLVGGDHSLDESMPLKSLKQLSGRKSNIYIRYKERGDVDCDYVRVYPGILKYKNKIHKKIENYFILFLELMIILK
jgi:hypothetical protein